MSDQKINLAMPLDRAHDIEKAIRVHKAREARKRAAEKRRLERDKDRDGAER